MFGTHVILNETEARRARAVIARIDEALASKAAFEPIKSGLPVTALESHRKAIVAQRASLAGSLDEYSQAKSGKFSPLAKKWQDDPGIILIVARLARGWSQADLAKK